MTPLLLRMDQLRELGGRGGERECVLCGERERECIVWGERERVYCVGRERERERESIVYVCM